ncbi:heme-binding protein [Alkalispirochaeta odontotermitis]|nr:heme-binding protein [Alkalispirochaeta odontotermitis]
MAIEKAKYDIVASDPDFEIRQYGPQIVAETLVEGDFEKVGNEGFRRLYDYITGNNRKKQSIAMTAPVTQEVGSVEIAMTAPVSQVKMDNKWRITFMMPSDFSMEDLPDPLDPRVRLKREPGRIAAALKYSGTWSKSRYEAKKKTLGDLLSKRGLKPAGEPVWARYDPPFMPWFLRRNEVLIPVEK